MWQSSLIQGKVICNWVMFLLSLCAGLMIVVPGYAGGSTNNFIFNGINNKADSMFYSDNDAGGGKSPAPFKAEVGRKLADGIKVTVTGSQYAVKLTPITLSKGIGTRTGNCITYMAAPGVHIIYTFKGNGVKEDIVFDHPSVAPADLRFHLEIDPMLEARLDHKGNVLIYGPNSILSDFIQTGDEKSAGLILNARQRASKDNLLYIIPAPVVIDGRGVKHKSIAHYSLEKSILTFYSAGLSRLSAPLSIDPSIVVTTTADFITGNNEGMISFDVDAVSRAVPSGGSIGNWTTAASFPTARYAHRSVAYNGYLYVIGGMSGSGSLADVWFAPIHPNGTIGMWVETTSLPALRWQHTSVVYNGYLYVIGGWVPSTGWMNDVLYAHINADGTIGEWTATTSFATPRVGHASVVYNGCLYVMGGQSSTGNLNDVQFAPINADGTVGAWTFTTSFPTVRFDHTSVAYHGYLYIIGGYGEGYRNDVQFARINANGTVGSWFETTSFAYPRDGHTSLAYNGYLYVICGQSSGGLQWDVQFSPINANGTLGPWTTATADTYPPRTGFASVAYNGYLYILGGYSSTSYLNDVQFAPFNSDGAVTLWNNTTSFTMARYGHASVSYNGYLYVIGGYNGSSSLNDVQFAVINFDGTIGAWSTTNTFATPRYGHTAVAYNGYLYVIGGWSGSAFLNDIQYAPINADGTLGGWITTTSFNTPRQGHTTVVYNNYLYVIGGWNGGTPFNDVQFAPINTDGSLGAWATTTGFPTGRYRHTSVVYSGYLYIIGGYDGMNSLNNVQFATINADGTIGAWTSTTSFLNARQSHASVAYNGRLYVTGGLGSTIFSDVQFAIINTDGTLGAWTATYGFFTARSNHTLVAHNGRLYLLGGWSGSAALKDVQFTPINFSGTLSSWTYTSFLSVPRASHTSVAYNGYLYVLGGYDGTSYSSDVLYAPINENGTIGAWTITTSFNTPRKAHTSVVYNGYLYVIGGSNYSGGNQFLNDVQFAPINPDGTVGTWTYTTSFNTGREEHSSVAYNGYLYVMGGGDGDIIHNDVQFAPIFADGTVGAWTYTTSFNMWRYGHTSVAYNGFLYVIGGIPCWESLNDVQFAPIYPNGTLGPWKATTSFSKGRNGHASVVFNGYLYVIGRWDLKDVQFAPVNSDGTVGSWYSTNASFNPRSDHTAVAYNGYLYVIGGRNGSSFYPDVLFTTLNGPAAQAGYSKLLDIGSDQIVDSISFSSSGARNGIVNLSYAVAPSDTAEFGTRTMIPNAASGMLYTTGLSACARYAWVHFDLDDRMSATIDSGELIGRKDLLDFTLNYNTLAGIGTSLGLTKISQNLHLSWSLSPNATSYNVLRCDSTTIPCTPVTIASPTTNSYDDLILVDSSNYWYLINAVNGTCMSGIEPSH